MARKHFLKPLKDLWIYNNSIGKSFNREKLFELGKKNIGMNFQFGKRNRSELYLLPKSPSGFDTILYLIPNLFDHVNCLLNTQMNRQSNN